MRYEVSEENNKKVIKRVTERREDVDIEQIKRGITGLESRISKLQDNLEGAQEKLKERKKRLKDLVKNIDDKEVKKELKSVL